MPNRWTRVPDNPPSPLPRWASAAVPIADAFMLAMLSRPGSGSLRQTWVTPGTLLLAFATALAAIALAAFCALAVAGGGWPPLLGLVASLLFLAGSAAVAVVGVAQRRR